MLEEYTDNLVAVKWYDNHGVNLVGTALQGCDEVASVLRRSKGQNS